MFTNEDFLRYISELEIVERNMHDVYVSIINKIDDDNIKDIFQKLIVDESEHINIVSHLKKIAIQKII